MRTIWKYELVVKYPGHQAIVRMPRGAHVFCAREQGPEICVWADVDTDAPAEPRTFEVFGTGWEFPPGERRYVGTAMLDGGRFVFHVYERTGG